MEKKDYRDTPFGDSALSIEARLDYLVDELSIEEKLTLLSSSSSDIERLSMPGMAFGGEAAHGVEARNDQMGSGEPDITTSFPQPIGMSSSWDTETIRMAGEVTGKEARVIYHRHPRGGLSRWAPTVDLERDPRWGRNEEGYGEDPVLTGAMAGAYIQGMQGNNPKYLRIAATLKHFYANNVEFGRGWRSSSIDPRNKYEYYLEPFRRAIQDGGVEAVMTAYNRINGVQGIYNDEVRTILKKEYGLVHAVSDGAAMGLVVSFSHDKGLDAETIAAALKAGVDAMSDYPPGVHEAAKEAYELGLISEADLDRAIRNVYRTRLRLGIYDRENNNPYDLVDENDLCSAENQEICRRLSDKSIVLLKNDGILPLSLSESEKKTAIIGPYADVWYQDWYGGEPHHRTTLKAGMEAIGGMTNISAICDARDVVQLKCGDKYLASDEAGRLIISADPEQFVVDDWGENTYSFKSIKTGKYMNTRISDNPEEFGEGISGEVYVDKDSIFGWFVLETFHLKKVDNNFVNIQSRFADTLFADSEGKIYSGMHSYEKEHDALEIEFEIVRNGIDDALLEARKAETVILALGHNPMVNAKEETDRASIDFIPYQQKLFDCIYAVNKNIIVVLHSDYPYAINEINQKAKAIIWTATGSQDMGSAVARTLYGINAPAGRLVQTWYKSDMDLPDINDYDIIEGKRTYRYFDKEVLYPFGYGLTYTDFEYSDCSVQLNDGCTIHIEFRVTNIGKTASDEVVQIYAAAPKSRVAKPIKQLIAFERVYDILPGESVDLSFDISTDELKFYDVIREGMVIEEGIYTIYAGKSSSDLPIRQEIFVPGVKTIQRDMCKKLRADHYDRQSGAQIVEGCYGYKALMAASDSVYTLREDGHFSSYYGECLIKEEAKEIRIHAYIPKDSVIKVKFDNVPVGEFVGNTQAYELHPVRQRDYLPRAVSDYEKLKTSWPVIWADIRIPLKDITIPKRACEVAIEASGTVMFDWIQIN